MAAAAVFLLAGSFAMGEAHVFPERTVTWVALAYLVSFGSILVFVLYVVVLGRWSASRASYLFVLVPVITVVLSAWLDDEPIGLGLVLGGFMVLAGCTSAPCVRHMEGDWPTPP